VIVGGSAVTMSRWLGDVGAVLFAWYPGEEGGSALADVLWGDVSPSGRLPITFPMSEGQLPLTYDHKPTGRGDDYLDLTGQPLFPFGHGLSYTTFAYSDLRIDVLDSVASTASRSLTDAVPRAVKVRVRARVTNTGARAGSEVVQLYLRDVLTSVAQPLIALKGFTRIALQPGASRDVEFTLSDEQLQLLNEDMRWVVEPGVFRVMVGASSKDIKLRGEFTLR
jgi:beta-glucosidase